MLKPIPNYTDWAQAQLPQTNQFAGFNDYGNQVNSTMGIDPGASNPLPYSGVQPTMDWTAPYVNTNNPMAGLPDVTTPGALDFMGSQGFKNGLDAVGGIARAFLGMKQYGLAQEQLAFSKEAFNKNYAANRTTTNTRLEDRQRARVGGSAPGTYESVDAYMAKNRIA